MGNCSIVVIKKNIHEVETWRYPGTILHADTEKVTLEAYFNRPDMMFHGILLGEGDRFVETFFRYRWYNIFSIYDRDSQIRKGWYCNLSYPAEIRNGYVSYVDLGLDLLVYPDGRQLVLDQEEYEALDLPIQDRLKANQSFIELQKLFKCAFLSTVD